MLVAPIFNAVMAAVLWLGRTGVLLLLYPLMLLIGWLRLWVRERGQIRFLMLWRTHGPVGLHRFGWQEAALDVEYLLATLLIVLSAAGVGLIIYWASKAAGL